MDEKLNGPCDEGVAKNAVGERKEVERAMVEGEMGRKVSSEEGGREGGRRGGGHGEKFHRVRRRYVV
jgi:hypothetical protein